MQKKPVVIIVGAGYAGVRVALDLAKKKIAHVILVDKNPYHALPTQYYELATFFREEHHGETSSDVKRDFHKSYYSAAVPLSDIFGAYPDVEILQAEVSHVHPKEFTVFFADGRKCMYDWLVFAIGSQTNYFGIPHLEQNSIGLKTVEDALNVRDKIDELFYNAPKNKKIRIVVGGGGFAGTEIAGELAGYIKRLARIHGHPIGNWECVVVEAGPTLLGSSSAWAQEKAKKRLTHLGVTLLFGHPIVDVWPNLLYIGEDRRSLPFDLLVWTAGVKGSCLGGIIEGIEPSKRNCVPVDEFLRVETAQHIFVAGDVAATLDPKTHNPMPMTAQKAIGEAQYISKALSDLIKNPKAKLQKYAPKSSSFIIPIAGKYAILETPYFKMSGILVWALKYVVVLKYALSILSPARALNIVTREIRLYTKND